MPDLVPLPPMHPVREALEAGLPQAVEPGRILYVRVMPAPSRNGTLYVEVQKRVTHNGESFEISGKVYTACAQCGRPLEFREVRRCACGRVRGGGCGLLIGEGCCTRRCSTCGRIVAAATEHIWIWPARPDRPVCYPCAYQYPWTANAPA